MKKKDLIHLALLVTACLLIIFGLPLLTFMAFGLDQ